MFEFLGLCLVGQGEIPRMNTRGGDNQIFAWGNTLRLNFLCANFLRLRPLVVGRGSRAFNSAKVPADQGASFLVHNYVKIVHNGVLLYRMFVRGVGERMQNLCTVCTFDIYFHFRLSIISYKAACEVMGNTRESRMEYFCCELDFLKEQGSKKRFFWFIAIKYQSSYNKTIVADDNASIPENTVLQSLGQSWAVELAKDNGKLCLPKWSGEIPFERNLLNCP